MNKKQKHILWFSEISKKDVALVGGKNASLGEMIKELTKKGINIPDGFALTSSAFWHYLKFNKIDEKLKEVFNKFNPKSVKSLQETGKAARDLILKGEFSSDLKKEILENYKKLSRKYKQKNTDAAVRSSATAEDLASASFAGQHETYLNVSGQENLLKAIKKCIASLFTDRAISYRNEKGFGHLKIALSVGIQKMIKSDLASAGVIFTLDTETGFRNVVLINSIYGVGEMIVKGKIIPDEFYVFKPTLKQGYKSIIRKDLGRKTKKYVYSKTGGLKEVDVSEKDQLKFSLNNDEILILARWACEIENHYGIPQDIEWAKDGKTGNLFIVQSRPETVFSPSKISVYEEYEIKTKAKPILTGIAIGNRVGQGRAKIIPDISKISQFQKGEVLVAKMTDPDWVSVFPLASAIVTDEGGATCHAAIVSRELGVPCIVGTRVSAKVLKNNQEITIDCTQGKTGRIFEGKVSFVIKKYSLKKIPKLATKIMVNIGAPDIAFKTSFLPNNGAGLTRQEFIIAEKIRIHPLALYYHKEIQNPKSEIRNKSQIPNSKFQAIIKQIDEITIEHKDKKEFFIKELAEGIGQIAAAFWPKPVIVRLSDLKTNEYRALIGGELFEPEEANPMLGWRGASRYYDEKFKPAFEMEVQAIKRVRDIFGLKNIKLMIPFCRTPKEAEKVLKLMKEYGLERGKDGLEVFVMCEIPSNVLLVEKFLDIFDGMSIGSNDLTQLILGIDRDSALISKIGDERNEAVKEMIKRVITVCKKRKKYIGICGEAPANIPGYVKFLIKCGIDSISVNPDSVTKTILLANKAEKKQEKINYENESAHEQRNKKWN